jgi:hypothetical protein
MIRLGGKGEFAIAWPAGMPSSCVRRIGDRGRSDVSEHVDDLLAGGFGE